MTKSVSLRVARAPTMLASAPSPKCVCPRMAPGCSRNVRLTRSSNSRIRTICVYIQINRSFPRSSFLRIARSSLHWRGRSRRADLAEGFADRHFYVFSLQNFQQHTFRRRFQFVAHLLRLEFNDRLAQLYRIPLLLEPAHDIGFGGGDSAGLRNLENGDDGPGSSWADKFISTDWPLKTYADRATVGYLRNQGPIVTSPTGQ